MNSEKFVHLENYFKKAKTDFTNIFAIKYNILEKILKDIQLINTNQKNDLMKFLKNLY